MHLRLETIKSLILIIISVSCATCNVPNHEKLYWQRYVYHPNNQLLVLHGLSISDCVRECRLRPGCLSINYKKYIHKCEINDIGAQPDLSFNTRVVFTKRPDWNEVR